MKPRNKMEREVLELSIALPKAPEKAWRKAQSRLSSAIWLKKNGAHKCLTCGHEWQTGPVNPQLLVNQLPVTCPRCGLQTVPAHRPKFLSYDQESTTILVLTVCQQWQVLRVLKLTRINATGEDARFERSELYQIWIAPDGREVVVGRDFTRTPFCLTYKDTWSVHRHNDGGTGYFTYSDMFDCSDARQLYRPVRLSETVRRNGLTPDKLHNCSGYVIYEIIRKVLTDPRIEHVAKRGTGSMLRLAALMTSDRDFTDFIWPAMRVCLRHGYMIDDAASWRDMVKIQHSYGCDIRSPRYVCPIDFHKEHDYWVRRDERRREEQAREERRRQAEEKERRDSLTAELKNEYAETHQIWQGVAWDIQGFRVLAYSTAEELKAEGEAMGHCVAGYYCKTVQMTRHSGTEVVNDSLILSIRDVNGKRLETAEISPDALSVVQCRAAHNGMTKQHYRIVRALQDLLPDIRRRLQEASQPKISVMI